MESTRRNLNHYRVLSGYCPDEACRTQLFFPRYDSSVECPNCGQRHQQSSLRNIAEVMNPNLALEKILRNILFANKSPKKGPDTVKVLGFSNYECKILSPLLSRYGMDKTSGKAKLLSEMGQGEIFDCGVLGDRAFLIEPEQMEVSGYGRDHTGSALYLQETLEAIKKNNNNKECLLPIHADGDGHCLVHAISRALIGRELFWHALRANLKEHFKQSLDKYKQIFSDFVDNTEWIDIIEECDPDFMPRDGEPMGLRNIHIFGLANILRRPIILLDSITGIQSSADYTGVFLPGLVEPERCRGKDGQRNKPLCIAWSSNGHNHYIALVGVKGRPLPVLPGWMIPKSWGMPQPLLTKYIDFEADGGCVIGGAKCLGDKYILRLVKAMEEVFRENNGVSAALVADVNQYIFKSTGLVSVAPEIVTQETARSVRENRLYRCISCTGLTQFNPNPDLFMPNGRLYRLAFKTHGKLDPTKHYSFPVDSIICTYDKVKDVLIPDMKRSRLNACSWCPDDKVRLVREDGSIVYMNGDRTPTPTHKSRCQCGYKHYWDGLEYDNIPLTFPVKLEWGGKVITEKVVWFEDETDPALNSNVFDLAQKLVQRHFPGEFGSERLVQKVVSRILDQTAIVAKDESAAAVGAATARSDMATDDKENQVVTAEAAPWDDMAASKIILSGHSKKSVHKEELTKSNAEKELHQRIETKAGQTQRRRTMEQTQDAVSVRSPTKVSPKQQKTTLGALKQPVATSSQPAASGSKPTPTTSPSPGATATSSAATSVQITSSTAPGIKATASSSVKSEGTFRVRVSTSDGRQTQLTLEKGITYSCLQRLLSDNLQVPVQRQRIKAGFPPRELLPPPAGEVETPLPLQHGDRVTVEILPDASLHAPVVEAAGGPKLNSTDKLLQNLTAPQADDIDQTITTLALMAGLTGSDLWSQVQAMPHLFEPGGAYYEQVKRDLSLTPNKHCTLPTIPDKVFRYNADEDVLELCLEPHGHFRVAPGIEDRILGSSHAESPGGTMSDSLGAFSSFSSGNQVSPSVQAALRSGAQGVRTDPKMNYGPARNVPFSGRGQSMAGSSLHQSSILTSGSSNHSMASSSGSPARSHQAIHPLARTPSDDKPNRPAIARTDTPMETDQPSVSVAPTTATPTTTATTSALPKEQKDPVQFKRIGPGYRVLKPQAQNDVNTSIAQIGSVAEALQQDVLKDDRYNSPIEVDDVQFKLGAASEATTSAEVAVMSSISSNTITHQQEAMDIDQVEQKSQEQEAKTESTKTAETVEAHTGNECSDVTTTITTTLKEGNT